MEPASTAAGQQGQHGSTEHGTKGGGVAPTAEGGGAPCEPGGSEARAYQGSLPLSSVPRRLSVPSKPSLEMPVPSPVVVVPAKQAPKVSKVDEDDEVLEGSLEVLGLTAADGKDPGGWLLANSSAVLERAFKLSMGANGDKALRRVLVQGVVDLELSRVKVAGEAFRDKKALEGKGSILLEAAKQIEALGPAGAAERLRKIRERQAA